ncbi:MAG TPA: HD domain-containing protein [Solirubrobacteraceae bacterium]|nr:HD domain-containing protein [Solirubrobacteraceae bacterium]
MNTTQSSDTEPRTAAAGVLPEFMRGPLTAAAVELAKAAHDGQLRKDGSPFLVHPLEVAGLAWSAGAEEEVIAAAVLHDILERTSTPRTLLQRQLGERVARIVVALTQDERIASYHRRKAALRSQAIAAGADAHVVFAADKISKTRELYTRIAARDDRAPTDKQRARLRHYEASLQALQQAAPGLRLVDTLALELWSLRTLPPLPRPGA